MFEDVQQPETCETTLTYTMERHSFNSFQFFWDWKVHHENVPLFKDVQLPETIATISTCTKTRDV